MSANGCQPTSVAFMKACSTLGIQRAFTSDNNSKGNADTEWVMRPFKEECLWLQEGNKLMAWKTMSILFALFCTSAFAMPFGKTPFGELIHSRSVAADIVVHVEKGEAEEIYTRLRQHPDVTCAKEGCMLEASLIELPNGRRLGTRLACGRGQGQLSYEIDLETNAPHLKQGDRSRLFNLKTRLTGQTAEALYARLVLHPEAFNAVGNSLRERTLNIALLQREGGNPLTESRVICSERPNAGMVCVLKIEYQEGSFPSSGINVLD